MEIKDYLKYYIGCQCLITKINVRSRQLIEEEGSIFIISTDILHSVLLGNIEAKPFLRNLKDMEFEDQRQLLIIYWNQYPGIETCVFKIHDKEVKKYIKHGTGVGYSLFSNIGEHKITGTLSYSNFSPEQFHYLLSRGYDLFQLIPAGLAIDKNEIR